MENGKTVSIRIEAKDDAKEIPDEISLQTVNRKLETFVEVVLKRMIDQQKDIKKLKDRVAALEKKNVR